MRVYFEKKLKELQAEIEKMGEKANRMLDLSMTALIEDRDELIDEILRLEDEVDAMDNRIEEKCARLIATQQPIAKDLRIITAAFKIITDVERIADYSVDIAFIARDLSGLPQLKPYIEFPKMKDVIHEMLKKSLKAYADRDVETCRLVGRMDNEIDSSYKKTVDELVELMKQDPENVYRGVKLILAARYLERIADHITNIAERIVYMETGEMINLSR